MKLKRTLATATALGLLTGSAMAIDGNFSKVYQEGKFNEASIDQSEGSDNQAGSASQAITQVRNHANTDATKNNRLTIVQSGNENTVGLGLNGNTFGNSPGIHQKEAYSGGSTYAPAKNIIDIIQSSDNNTVGAVSQESATHAGNNSLVIVQGGAGNNKVGSVSQYRSQTTQNITEIEQTGQDNTVARVEQYVTGYGGPSGAIVNRLDVTMTGSNNGNGAWTAGGHAAVSGALSSTLIQGGPGAGKAATDSYALLDISGNDNQFGVTQYGQSNTVGSLIISGNANELGTYQIGGSNIVTVAAIAGDGNNIGIYQNGISNLAGVDVGGDDNRVGVLQTGDDNEATVDITGDGNGGGTLNGVAGALASDTGSTLYPSIASGQIIQAGLDNNASLTIAGGGGNQFAYLQEGNDNEIVGDVDGAGGNSATHVQVGDGNMSSFTQTGLGNMVSVSQ